MLPVETINYSENGTDLIGTVVLPEGDGQRPGVVVLGDLTGCGPYPTARAQQIASELGYIALAGDIYGGGRSVDVEEGMELVGSYLGDPERLAARTAASVAALKAHPRCTGDVAIIGFCFGGGAVLAAAREGVDFKAGVSFHGVLATSRPAKVGEVRAKLLVCHGDSDPFAPLDTVTGFIQEMASAQSDCQTIVYSGTVHSFTQVEQTGEVPGALYSERADNRSWSAMKALFQETFGN